MRGLGGVGGRPREGAVESCTASRHSPELPGADRAAPLRRSGGTWGRGTQRKGMLPGGRGGDWAEVKEEGVGARPGAGDLDQGKPRPAR